MEKGKGGGGEWREGIGKSGMEGEKEREEGGGREGGRGKGEGVGGESDYCHNYIHGSIVGAV